MFTNKDGTRYSNLLFIEYKKEIEENEKSGDGMFDKEDKKKVDGERHYDSENSKNSLSE